MEDLKAPVHLRAEHNNQNPALLGTGLPRLSWQYEAQYPTNASVQIRICRGIPGVSETEVVAEVPADKNILCPWPIEELDSLEHARINVRLAADGEVSAWSEPIHVERGFRSPYLIQAHFVGPAWLEAGTEHRRCPIVRTEFALKKKPVYARLLLSALGLVEPRINGQKITEDILIPGWTSYDGQLDYRMYDITPFVEGGNNAAGFILADGWYRGRVGFNGGKVNVYGDKVGVLARIDCYYEDGTQEQFLSNAWDGRWRATKSPILMASYTEGETYDPNREVQGWDMPGLFDNECEEDKIVLIDENGARRLSGTNFADPEQLFVDVNGHTWYPTEEVPYNIDKLRPAVKPPVRMVEELRPVTIEKQGELADGRGIYLLDFGQNCSMRLRLKMKGLAAGEQVRLRHAEVLEPDGSLCTRTIRRALQLDLYISDGIDREWEPIFTMHGMRYAEIRGWRGELTAEDVIGIAYMSDMERTGSFSCDDPRVNKLYQNVLWSMRSNFIEVPTDCPNRDERLGWTGDAAIFSSTANRMYDVQAFLASWMQDLAHEQQKWGTVPFYVPFIPLSEWSVPQAIAIWGDASVMVPWSIYTAGGDKELLAQHYGAAHTWIEEVLGYVSENGIWDRRPEYALGQLGDWLDPTAPPNDPAKAMTPKEMVATTFLAYTTDLLAQMAADLGKDADADYYAEKAEWLRESCIKAFIHEDGSVDCNSQCAYALCIALGILKNHPELQQNAGNRLAELVRASAGKVGTGFAGTAYVLPALTMTGHVDEAMELFLSEECPSWLYQVRMGGTTTWERWDSMLPDGSINPGGMTSFNHYSLGSVVDWVEARIGGLAPLAPGWSRFAVVPGIKGAIKQASVSHNTPAGEAACSWTVSGDELNVTLQVPVGTEAVLQIPGYEDEILSAGCYQLQRKI